MRIAGGVLAAGLLAFVTPAAWADSTFDKTSVPANADVVVTVAASVDELNAYQEKVWVDVPDGFRVLSCGRVEGFSCTFEKATVTWQRTAPGQPVPLATDQFPFRMHTADRPGRYTFAVTQLYTSGNADRSTPVVQVTPAAAPASTTTTTVARAAARRSAVSGGSAVRTSPRAAGHVAVTEPAWFGDNSGDAGPQMALREAGADERATSARTMTILGAVASLAAVGVFRLRRLVRAG